MALIKWQTNARTHLRSIYNYYKKNVSLKVASAIRDTIVTSVDILENFPASGVIDFELSTQDTTYFFIVAKKVNEHIGFTISMRMILATSWQSGITA